jgi:predicted lipoprotein with Yx(FWY)xxD motif
MLSMALTGVISVDNAAAQDGPDVTVRPTGFGNILADPDGFTLYMWAGDEPGVSNCYDACADEWPPYTLGDNPIAPPGFPGTLGLIERDDGMWQVALDDMPLYYFAGDDNPGAANGQGSLGVGAPWHIGAFGPPAGVPAQSSQSYGTPQFSAPGQLQAPASMPAPPTGTRPAQGQPYPPPGYGGMPSQPPGPGYPYVQTGPVGPAYPQGNFSQTLTIQAPPNGIVGISWIANPAASSYRVYQTPVSQPLNFTVTQTIQQPTGQLVTNALLTTLSPGNTYYVQVRMVSPNGQESVTPVTSFTSPSLGR